MAVRVLSSSSTWSVDSNAIISSFIKVLRARVSSDTWPGMTPSLGKANWVLNNRYSSN
jgi:hypothetical protein